MKVKRVIDKKRTGFLVIIGLLFHIGSLYSQEKGITIQMYDTTLEQVLLEIRKQTGYDYILNDDVISPGKKISIDVQNGPIEMVLDNITQQLGIEYKLVEKTIIFLPVKENPDEFNHEKEVLKQTVRGIVVDKDSHIPLFGANVVILNTYPLRGSISGDDGTFTVTDVPIGRYDIKISFIGYKPRLIPEILITSAKEIFLNVELEESVEKLDELVIKPSFRKDKSLNPMASVSARSFTVEESQRYAGGVGDPPRMASAYAGVAVGYDLDNNAISVRGNRPKAVTWRLEDVDIPNPNHFEGAYVAGAGFACLISNQLMDNSDFFTGAFPAEYGNSLGAVFDLSLRSGNTYNNEYTFQAGVLGIDFATEGPFKKGKKSSYNINYRYSTLGLLLDLGIVPEGMVPRYQDLSFKLRFPTSKAGIFSIWAIGGIDYNNEEVEKDSLLWEYEDDRDGLEVSIQTGALGISNKYIFGDKTYMKTSLVASGAQGEGETKWIDNNLIIQRDGLYIHGTGTITLSPNMD